MSENDEPPVGLSAEERRTAESWVELSSHVDWQWNALLRVDDTVQAQAAEIEKLGRWKKEALAIEATWDLQAIGKSMGLSVGAVIRKEILPFIEKLKLRVTELERERDEHEAMIEILRLELGNLLAIIHRDGGHYITDHGWQAAVKDAHEVWAQLQLGQDELTTLRERVKRVCHVETGSTGQFLLSKVDTRNHSRKTCAHYGGACLLTEPEPERASTGLPEGVSNIPPSKRKQAATADGESPAQKPPLPTCSNCGEETEREMSRTVDENNDVLWYAPTHTDGTPANAECRKVCLNCKQAIYHSVEMGRLCDRWLHSDGSKSFASTPDNPNACKRGECDHPSCEDGKITMPERVPEISSAVDCPRCKGTGSITPKGSK